jgi:2'-5' RNA ligase
MIRSFIALPLPSATAYALEALQRGLPLARPVPAEDMHLTLAFLDDQPEHLLREVAEALDTIHAAPVAVRLSGITVLGGKHPGAIAVNADGGEALERLQARVARTVRDAGLELERRRFRPHVTIFRLSKRAETIETARIQSWIDRNGQFPAMEFTAPEMVLYRSILHKSGAAYDRLAEYPLMPREI